MHVFERARTKYHMFRTHGPHMVSKKLIQIMSTLLPLRRICSGGQLSDKDLAVVSIFIHAQHDSLASSKLKHPCLAGVVVCNQMTFQNAYDNQKAFQLILS